MKEQQLYIAGTEPPPDPDRTPELDAHVHGWLDAKEQQAKAAADSKLRHVVMLAALEAAGVTRYPYTDRSSGKKRYVVIKRDPKAVTTKPPQIRKAKDEKRAEKAREKKQRDAEESVEHRKVSRKEAGEVADRPLTGKLTATLEETADPFERTRQSMEGATP